MSDVIVLVMHGTPPKDFSPNEAREYFTLHGKLGDHHGHSHADNQEHSQIERRFMQLERKMRSWPRNSTNDPFFVGSQELAEELERVPGLEVILAFNEFCAPSVDEAFDLAVSKHAARVIAITPMMTFGGGHSEVNIPSAIERAKEKYPSIEFIYAWPYQAEEVASFLAAQIKRV